MTAPTGEAVNYETAVAELTAIINELGTVVDNSAAAAQDANDAKAAINNAQEAYRTSAAAAQSVLDHLAALNIDAATLANLATTADALPPNRIDEMYDQLEAVAGDAEKVKSDAETARAAAETALQTVQEKYGDAHSTVASELGGDSRFLDSGGATTAAEQPQPAPTRAA